MRQLLGSQLRSPGLALWLRPSWVLEASAPSTQQAKRARQDHTCFFSSMGPPHPLLPTESHSPPLTCPVGLETQVQADSLPPQQQLLTGQELIDSELLGLPTAGGPECSQSAGERALVPHGPRRGGFVVTLGSTQDLLTE